MTTVNIYLTFNGNCKEAFDLYKAVLGGEFLHVGTFADMPPQEGAPALTEEMKKKIMHISLSVSKETMIMGSDTGGEWSNDFKQGNNFSISVSTDSKKEADHIFSGLSRDGEITMPIKSTFWGDYFGMVKDKFGVNWMVSFNENPKQH